MCGIAGFVARQPLGEARARSLAHAMAERLIHRGPDAEGVWSDPDGRVALGHRRLSIIDLSVAGSQPMTSASACIVRADNDVLAAAVIEVLNMLQEALRSWGDAARQLVQFSFSLESVTDRWLDLYGSLMEPMVP